MRVQGVGEIRRVTTVGITETVTVEQRPEGGEAVSLGIAREGAFQAEGTRS